MAARQPKRSVPGIVVVIGLAAVLGVAFGGPQSSLELVGPISTFALPMVVLIALWWDVHPGARFAGPWVGLVNSGLVVSSGFVLAIVGQAIVGPVSLRSLYVADPRPADLPLYPATLALAAAAFVTLLHFTLVCDGWPFKGSARLERMGRFAPGVVAAVASWAIAVAVYLLLVNTNDTSAVERASTGLRNPGGPVSAGELGNWLVATTSWQLLVFVGLNAWPFKQIELRSTRLWAANGFVLAAGTAWWALLRHGLGWSGGQLTALGGGIVAASLIVVLLFDGWPGSEQTSTRERMIRLGFLVGLAVALDVVATVVGALIHDWSNRSAEEWSTFVTLNYVAGGVVIFTVLWKRWPQTFEPPPDTRAADERPAEAPVAGLEATDSAAAPMAQGVAVGAPEPTGSGPTDPADPGDPPSSKAAHSSA